MAKKKSIQPQRQLSPNEYIRTKARELPIYKCYINSYWLETGLTNFIIARQHKNGNFTLGFYFVDTYYQGLFQSGTHFNYTKDELEEFIGLLTPKISEKHILVEIAYSLAHNIIYGGIAFAKKNGFKINKEFEISKYILEEDDGKIEYIEIEFGKSEFREKEKEKVILERFKNIK